MALEAFAESHKLKIFSGPFWDSSQLKEFYELVRKIIAIILLNVNALLAKKLFEYFLDALVDAVKKIAGKVFKMLFELKQQK